MTVYVDNMRRRAKVGRFEAVWSHLFADTHDELMQFARALKLRPEWLQHEGTHREHYDVTELKRYEAIRLGAQEISYPREVGELIARKRAAPADPVMPLYRSRPSVVEAVQWLGDNAGSVRAFGAKLKYDPVEDDLFVLAGKSGAQGYVPVPVGHWIVRNPGDRDDHWPVDPDYFASKYEPVEAGEQR